MFNVILYRLAMIYFLHILNHFWFNHFWLHTHTHARTHARTHTRTHTHTHAHTHTHTHSCAISNNSLHYHCASCSTHGVSALGRIFLTCKPSTLQLVQSAAAFNLQSGTS